MPSNEGESVHSKMPIDAKKASSAQDWLLGVEIQMRVSLVCALEEVRGAVLIRRGGGVLRLVRQVSDAGGAVAMHCLRRRCS